MQGGDLSRKSKQRRNRFVVLRRRIFLGLVQQNRSRGVRQRVLIVNRAQRLAGDVFFETLHHLEENAPSLYNRKGLRLGGSRFRR
jgi:hypothetical protein